MCRCEHVCHRLHLSYLEWRHAPPLPDMWPYRPHAHSDMSPEMFGAHLTGGNYDAKPADVWACGVLLFGLLYGEEPWITNAYRPTSSQRHKITEQILAVKERIEYQIPPVGGRCTSPATLDLLTGMLEHDMSKRLTLAQVKRHEYFTGYTPPLNLAVPTPPLAQGEPANLSLPI